MLAALTRQIFHSPYSSDVAGGMSASTAKALSFAASLADPHMTPMTVQRFASDKDGTGMNHGKEGRNKPIQCIARWSTLLMETPTNTHINT